MFWFSPSNLYYNSSTRFRKLERPFFLHLDDFLCCVCYLYMEYFDTDTHTHTHTHRHTEFLQWELYLGVMGVYVLNQTFSLPGPLHICAIVPC